MKQIQGGSLLVLTILLMANTNCSGFFPGESTLQDLSTSTAIKHTEEFQTAAVLQITEVFQTQAAAILTAAPTPISGPTSTLTSTATLEPGVDLEQGCIYSGNWTPIHRNNDFLESNSCWNLQNYGLIARNNSPLIISATGDFDQPTQGIYASPTDFTTISFNLTILRMTAKEPNTTNLVLGFGREDSEMSFGLFLVVRVFSNSSYPVAVVASSPTNIETPLFLLSLEENRTYPITITLHNVYADFEIMDSKTGKSHSISVELESQYNALFFIGYRMVDGGLISAEISNLQFSPILE